MSERPVLDKNLDSKTFRDYYYLKEELVNFCRENGIPVSGGKIEITDRIAYFLDTGKILSAQTARKKAIIVSPLSEDTKIDRQFEYNTYIRDFFADNKGKSLEEAIKCWKYKKQLQGHNRYERTDLVAIE